ncbi:DUF393 domain-containing protein [Shouchella clausii]|uniref:DUF393 domain-containing protein n=1 Tax=Shouchella clausii TaxID=79880 RepID=A0A268RWE3_SHOCL|nr:DUF393 domain-containing protein [Shouchella clausii]PAF24578.1 DUF393 domain-containing protein [Shouchella clausii]
MKTDIVFYDAQCPLCQAVKKVVMKLDWNRELRWFPVQSVSETTRTKAARYVDMYDEIYVLSKEGQVSIGFQAIRKILSRLPALAWLTPLLSFSLLEIVGTAAYRFISSHRHQWFGRLSLDKALPR